MTEICLKCGNPLKDYGTACNHTPKEYLTIADHNPELSAKCMEIVECDIARIAKYDNTLFLIIGFNRNTKDDSGQWYEEWTDSNGILRNTARDWNYVQECVVASGKTEYELIESVKQYKMLTEIDILEYLKRIANGT